MKIAIVGTGYVGLVSGACFAEMGLDITCVDIDAEKIEGLNAGVIPIYEPGLEELVRRNVEAGRLHFTTDLTECLPHVEVVFSAVGTPPDEDGSADLKYVLDVARTFGRHIRKYTVLVTKSTVPVGTAQKVRAVIEEELEKRGCKVPFDVASNPEFLKEGAAIKDFMSPAKTFACIESLLESFFEASGNGNSLCNIRHSTPSASPRPVRARARPRRASRSCGPLPGAACGYRGSNAGRTTSILPSMLKPPGCLPAISIRG